MEKIDKSCLNCFHFQWDGEGDAYCSEHVCAMPNPESSVNPDYGWCSDYIYKCYHCIYDCCPKNPKNVELV